MLALLLSGLGQAHADWMPSTSGAINVKDHGAVGDGRSDDTRALLAAIDSAQSTQGRGFWPAKMVYLPAGTYLVSDTLMKKRQGAFQHSFALVGESVDAVTLKLKDGAEGFGDAGRPRAVIYTSSGLRQGSATAGGKDYDALGEGNDAYGNYVEDLTVDVGRDNPGAIAIDFIANNVGAVRRVKLLAPASSGHTGISLQRKWPGPLLLSDVSIDGFAVGISVCHSEYGVTIDSASLRGQREVALRNRGNVVAVRNAWLDGPNGRLENIGTGALAIVDGLFLSGSNAGRGWYRNEGYLVFARVGAASVVSRSPHAAALRGVASRGALFGNRALPEARPDWRLRPAPPPALPTGKEHSWVSVAAFGASPDSGLDATDAIQAALNSGAESVYFPSGNYLISAGLVVPASVRKVEGMFSALAVTKARRPEFARTTGMLRVEGGAAALLITRIAFDNIDRGSQVAVEHSGSRELLLRDVITAGASTTRGSDGGPLWLENVCCGGYDLAGPRLVDARQLNTEGSGVRIVNRGAPLSVLGLKAEQNCTVLESQAGSVSEILGALLYPVRKPEPPRPAFIAADDARLTASYAESAYRPEAVYREHLMRTQNGGRQRTVVLAEDLPSRGLARIVPYLSTQRMASSPSSSGPPLAAREHAEKDRTSDGP